MAAPPDTLIAALLAAVLGVVAPATELVVTVLASTPAAACNQAGTRDLIAPTTTVRPGAADWPQLAARLSGELADSDDPEAQKLAQAIGDTGTPSTGTPSTGTRNTAAPSRSAAPDRPGAGRCPAPSGPDAPAGEVPASGVRSTRTPTGPAARPTTSSRSADRRWEQLAGQLAAALGGSTDPRAADLQSALDRAGFPSTRPSPTSSRATASTPRTTAIPAPADTGDDG